MSATMTTKFVSGTTRTTKFDHCKDACHVAGGKIHDKKVQAVIVLAFHEDSPAVEILNFDNAVHPSKWVRPVKQNPQ